MVVIILEKMQKTGKISLNTNKWSIYVGDKHNVIIVKRLLKT